MKELNAYAIKIIFLLMEYVFLAKKMLLRLIMSASVFKISIIKMEFVNQSHNVLKIQHGTKESLFANVINLMKI